MVLIKYFSFSFLGVIYIIASGSFLYGAYLLFSGLVQWNYLRLKVIFKRSEYFNIFFTYTPEEKILRDRYFRKITNGFIILLLSGLVFYLLDTLSKK